MRHSQLAINSISTQDVDLEIRLHDYRRAGFEKVEFSLAQIKNKMAVGFSI